MEAIKTETEVFITNEGKVAIQILIPSTGEIRRKIFTKSEIVKRMFQSQLKTWSKRYCEDYILE